MAVEATLTVFQKSVDSSGKSLAIFQHEARRFLGGNAIPSSAATAAPLRRVCATLRRFDQSPASLEYWIIRMRG